MAPTPNGVHFVPPARRRAAPWNPSKDPPFQLPQDLHAGCDEVLATLEDCAWLFPPSAGASASGAPSEGPAASPAPLGVAASGAPAGAAAESEPEAPSAPPPAAAAALAFDYEYLHLRSEISKGVVGLLLAAPHGQTTGDTVAARFGRALKDFAAKAYEVLRENSAIPESDRQNLVNEAENAVKVMVGRGGIRVHQNRATDLVFALEAFSVSWGRPLKTEQDWLCKCISHVIGAALGAADPEEKARWCEDARNLIKSDEGLKAEVDVRAWPHIVQLAEMKKSEIDSEAFIKQVRLQLCSQADLGRLYDGLRQAADLIKEMNQAAAFGAEQINEIFNNRAHFKGYYGHQSRKPLLTAILRSAPRSIKREVLRIMDSSVDITERDDEEMMLVHDLIRDLEEDIRCCPHTFFGMQRDWLVSKRTGVVFNEELSPEQICDHIETEDNYEELLRIAVNRCLKDPRGRKFEAARMLAREKSANCSVYHTHRNDKQLEYLVSLYKELTPPEDHFGPVEEAQLVLPCAYGDVLRIEDSGEALARLEQETLGSKRPMTVGLCWFWRCFDPKLDFWPRASILAIAYGSTFAIVDFLLLERETEAQESRGRGLSSEAEEAKVKGVIRSILEAPHLLKVVHDQDPYTLEVLQRTLVPVMTHWQNEEKVGMLLAPVIDLAVAAAFAQKTKVGAAANLKASGLAYDYLRLEVCMAEALSNVDRRPLRKSQIHYMLTLAWCPVAILRPLFAYQVVKQKDAAAMALRIDLVRDPQWGALLVKLRKLLMRKQEAVAEVQAVQDEGVMGDLKRISGAYAENLWEDEEWREKLPRPEENLDLAAHIQGSPVRALQLSPEAAQQAALALEPLFDRGLCARELRALYEAYRRHQESREAAQRGEELEAQPEA